jgi:hypothetical protein
MTPEEVTDWPARIALVLAMLALIAIAFAGMRAGWKRRQRTQSSIPAPEVQAPANATFTHEVDGLYVGAARAGDWLDRIAVHGLGVRSRSSISLGPDGIWLDRTGAPDIWLPRAQLLAARLDRGIAGTVRGPGSVVVLTWDSADGPLEFGFRADSAAGHAVVLDGLVSAGLTVTGFPVDGEGS